MKSRSRPPAPATSSKDAGSTDTLQPASLPISQQTINQIAQFLQQLPLKQQESWSIREAIAYLIMPINAAFAKGYSRAEIAAMIRAAGIPISDPSFKYQLLQLRSQSSSTAAANPTPTQRLKTQTTMPASTATSTFGRPIGNASDLNSTNSPHMPPHMPRDTVEDVISYLISDA